MYSVQVPQLKTYLAQTSEETKPAKNGEILLNKLCYRKLNSM